MCGIIGLISEEPVLEDAIEGLLALENRGKDSTGLIGYRSLTERASITFRSAKGASDAYDSSFLNRFQGAAPRIVVGHTRYATSGTNLLRDAQPLHATHPGITLAHNGQVANILTLEENLRKHDWHPGTTCDAELLLGALGLSLLKRHVPVKSTEEYLERRLWPALEELMDPSSEFFVNGAYSFVAVIEGRGLLGVRSPSGIRPLEFAERLRNGARTYAFASETSAFHQMEGFSVLRIEHGEGVFIDGDLQVHRKVLRQLPYRPCLFEKPYFAGVGSQQDGRSIYDERIAIGAALAREYPVARELVDVLMPIPDSPRPIAQEMAESLGIPHREGVVKNPFYKGRAFQKGTPEERRAAIKRKYLYIKSMIAGQRVGLVDDSIVRGDTSRIIIEQVRKLGAREVHLFVGFPLIRHPCVYGIDMSVPEELIGYRCGGDASSIAASLGADSVNYLSPKGLAHSLGRTLAQGCLACATGEYPGSQAGILEYSVLRAKQRRERDE